MKHGDLRSAISELIQWFGLDATEGHLASAGSPAARQEFKRQKQTLMAAELSQGNTPSPVVRERLIAAGMSRRTAYRRIQQSQGDASRAINAAIELCERGIVQAIREKAGATPKVLKSKPEFYEHHTETQEQQRMNNTSSHAFKPPQHVMMTPEQWALVRDNPIQRDTVRRADGASKGHLKSPAASHLQVHAARLPSGELIKVDGHTRSLLWSDGRLPAPGEISVAIYDVASEGHAIDLYSHFDSQRSVHGALDRLAGAYRLHDMNIKSEALSLGGVTAAFSRMIPRAPSIYAFVGAWRAELLMLDELRASKTKMPSVLIHAALLTLRKRGRKALQFWDMYLSDAGTKQDGKSDGVQKLYEMVVELRSSKKLGKGNEAVHQAARAVSCCESWLRGELYSGSVKFTHLDKYLSQ